MTTKKAAAKKPAAKKATAPKKAAAKKPAAKKATVHKAEAPKKVVATKMAHETKHGAASEVSRETSKETKKSLASDKQKIRVVIRAFDHKIVDDSAKIIVDTAERTGALVAGPIPLPTKIDRITVNKSTFVNKDAREQFEIRTHKRLIDIIDATSTTIGSLSNLNLPSGVDVEIKMIG